MLVVRVWGTWAPASMRVHGRGRMEAPGEGGEDGWAPVDAEGGSGNGARAVYKLWSVHVSAAGELPKQRQCWAGRGGGDGAKEERAWGSGWCMALGVREWEAWGKW